ncbi:hypothetical protein [Gayadomonas joobiniege]|uniref:hypothetical protein n=1 Tax=Gayadomonas joobiniege TaxID=1234606 RepID=UPI00037B76FF|nr:hypothetical protein [Gayadomonas joobiniege]
MRLPIFAMIATTLTLAACDKATAVNEKKAEPSALTQTTDQIHYHNAFLNLSIEKPQSWFAQSPEDTMKMSQQGSEILSGDDKNMKAMVDQSLKTSLPVFAFFEYEPGTPGKLNANVLSMAENIELAPGVKTGCDYLYHTREILNKSQLQVMIDEGCEQTKFGDTSMGTMNITMTMNNLLVKQTYYACIKDKHAVTVIKTYFDDESKNKVDNILTTLQLDCS